MRSKLIGTLDINGRAGPVRTCVGCRQRAAQSDLLRVVVARDDSGDQLAAVASDPRGRMPGRGAYLHPDPRCLELAVRRQAFPRALRHPGPLDLDAVREYVSRPGAHANAEWEAGREADEHSMSTQT